MLPLFLVTEVTDYFETSLLMATMDFAVVCARESRMPGAGDHQPVYSSYKQT
jgi:hypothetical protein